MISIEGLEKVFNAGKVTQVTALDGINLEIAAGEFVVIVGANGSGKSTLLNAVSGAIYASRGKVRLNGVEVTRMPEHKRSKWISRVFQNPLSGTASDLSILDNFRLAALRTRSKMVHTGITSEFKRLVRERIATLNMGLEDKIHQPMGTLSGGQRQALTLLMSVMDEGKILLLDEPTAALDPRSAQTVMHIADRLIRENELTAVLITHNLKDAFLFGNRIIQMNEGKIVRDLDAASKQNLLHTDIYEWFV